MVSRFAWLPMILIVAACSSNLPVEQVKSFSAAFKSANDAGQPLLDDLSVAERSQGKTNAEARAGRATLEVATPPVSSNESSTIGCPETKARWRDAGSGMGFIQGYCVADAPYFAALGDPPATRGFRGGLTVLGKYVDVLTFLAEGGNVEELHAQLQDLSSNIGQLLAIVPGAAMAGPAINGALTQLKPLIDAAAKQSNAQEIRRLVIEGSPAAKQLIQKRKEATPEIFDTLTAAAADEATGRQARNNPAIVKPEIERIEAYRATVSNFVVLLDGLETALDKLVIVVESPDESASVQTLADETVNLRLYADAVRKAFATLRQGK
jgi:hypothetical protein